MSASLARGAMRFSKNSSAGYGSRSNPAHKSGETALATAAKSSWGMAFSLWILRMLSTSAESTVMIWRT